MFGREILPGLAKVSTMFGKVAKGIISEWPTVRSKIVGVANAVIDVYNNSIALRTYLGLLKASVKTQFQAIGLIIKQAFLPIKTFGQVIGAILKRDFDSIKDIIKDGFSSGVDNYKEFGQKAAENFSGALKKAKDSYIKPISESIEDAVKPNEAILNQSQ